MGSGGGQLLVIVVGPATWRALATGTAVAGHLEGTGNRHRRRGPPGGHWQPAPPSRATWRALATGTAVAGHVAGAVTIVHMAAGQEPRAEVPDVQKTPRKHHFAAHENEKYTGEFKKITDKYGLGLDGAWNKEMLHYNNGRHPNEYQKWVLDQLQAIDKEAKGNVAKFLELFELHLKSKVREAPEMLRKWWW